LRDRDIAFPFSFFLFPLLDNNVLSFSIIKIEIEIEIEIEIPYEKKGI